MPGLPARQGTRQAGFRVGKEQQEFEYRRQGTVNVLLFLCANGLLNM
jgi:hypothetical protein